MTESSVSKLRFLMTTSRGQRVWRSDEEKVKCRVSVRLQEETLALRKEGIGVVLDSELPHLIGIDDDLLSTGIILYHLKVRGHGFLLHIQHST